MSQEHSYKYHLGFRNKTTQDVCPEWGYSVFGTEAMTDGEAIQYADQTIENLLQGARRGQTVHATLYDVSVSPSRIVKNYLSMLKE